eukprot:Skav216559  [mRNA]  locus=scaffold1776:483537:486679:- [translate_table: standard]
MKIGVVRAIGIHNFTPLRAQTRTRLKQLGVSVAIVTEDAVPICEPTSTSNHCSPAASCRLDSLRCTGKVN